MITDFLLNIILIFTILFSSNTSAKSKNYFLINCNKNEPKFIQINEYNDLFFRCGNNSSLQYFGII